MFDFPSVMDSYIEDFESQLKTALPASVVSFDLVEQTISAQIVIKEPFKDGDVLNYPVITDIPVMFPSAGGGSLTFPVTKGDEVLLIFSSKSFDKWWDTSEVGVLSTTQRYHDITDAIAIVGLTSKNNSTQASAEDVELKFNDNVVRLKADGSVEVDTKSTFKLTNPQEELISLLSEVVDEVSKITTNTVFGISPINNLAAITALKTRLDTFKG